MGAVIEKGIGVERDRLATVAGLDEARLAAQVGAVARVRRIGVFGSADGNAGAGLRDMAEVALPTRGCSDWIGSPS